MIRHVTERSFFPVQTVPQTPAGVVQEDGLHRRPVEIKLFFPQVEKRNLRIELLNIDGEIYSVHLPGYQFAQRHAPVRRTEDIELFLA